MVVIEWVQNRCGNSCCYTKHRLHSVFLIRTSNFGAEAERSYIFLRFEAENVLKMFLNYMVYSTCISVNQCGRDQETYQSDYDKPRCVSPL